MQGVCKIRGGRDNMCLDLGKASKQRGYGGWVEFDRYRWGTKVLNGWRNNTSEKQKTTAKRKELKISVILIFSCVTLG